AQGDLQAQPKQTTDQPVGCGVERAAQPDHRGDETDQSKQQSAEDRARCFAVGRIVATAVLPTRCVETRQPFPYRVGNGHACRSSSLPKPGSVPRYTGG